MLSLEKLLRTKAGHGLKKVVQRAQYMDDLAHKLQSELDPDLAEQIQAVNVREPGELVIVCGSSVWAARLRFESDRLVAVAQAAGVQVTRCRVKVGR